VELDEESDNVAPRGLSTFEELQVGTMFPFQFCLKTFPQKKLGIQAFHHIEGALKENASAKTRATSTSSDSIPTVESRTVRNPITMFSFY